MNKTDQEKLKLFDVKFNNQKPVIKPKIDKNGRKRKDKDD